jgi:hypothetical protein
MAQNQAKYSPPATASVAATGSSQATAALLSAVFNTITAADGTTSVRLGIPLYGDPDSGQGGITPIIVYNSHASNAVPVYPQTGATIDAEAANASVSLAAGQISFFYPLSKTAWRQSNAALASVLTSVTPGTVTASKAVVVDSNKDIGDFRNLDVTNLDAGLSGTAGTVDVFPSTAARGKLAIAAVDNTGNTTTTISNAAMGQASVVSIPDGGASTDTFLTAKAANAISSTLTQTSASAAAIKSGRQGATDPTLTIDNSTATCVTGLALKAAAAAAGMDVTVTSSGTDEDLRVNAKGAGKINLGGVSTGLTSLCRGSLKAPVIGETKMTGNAQNVTPLAAELLGGLYSHNSQTGGGTVTLDTAANIDTAIPGVANGDSFDCYYHNVGNQTATITTNTGLTLKGATVAIVTLKGALLRFHRVSAGAWDVYILAGA